MAHLGDAFSKDDNNFAKIHTKEPGVRSYMEGPLRTDHEGALLDRLKQCGQKKAMHLYPNVQRALCTDGLIFWTYRGLSARLLCSLGRTEDPLHGGHTQVS